MIVIGKGPEHTLYLVPVLVPHQPTIPTLLTLFIEPTVIDNVGSDDNPGIHKNPDQNTTKSASSLFSGTTSAPTTTNTTVIRDQDTMMNLD